MERVLLLNQSYEPIAVIGWKKAITLLFLEKAEIIHEYNKNIRSRFLTFKLPSVIRLFKSFNRPRKRVNFNKQNILARDRWHCQYCGIKLSPKELTYDHVIPRSQGGKTCWENIVACCIPCNIQKGNKTPQQANMHIRKKPIRPDWVPIFAITALSSQAIPSDWKEFCYLKDD